MKYVRFAFLAALAGCGGDDGGGAVVDRPTNCNPLADVGCAFPFPSSVFLVDDAQSASLVKVDIPAGALPANNDGDAFDTAYFNGKDGFSPNAPILMAFPGGVAADNLPPHTDPTLGLAMESPTVILDAATGQRVVHFAEVDMSDPEASADERALVIRPMMRLQEKTRYVVAITRALRAADGSELARPAGFQAFLDGETGAHPLLDRLAARREPMLATLAAAGLAPEDLLVAFELVTASNAQLQADMVNGRDAMLAALAAGGYGQITVAVNELPSDWDPALTDRRIDGTFTIPNLLTESGDNGLLNRDVEGRPTVNAGEPYVAPFTALVPACVNDNVVAKPVPILIYGHGLFGDAIGEASGGTLRKATQHMCMVSVATDWRGMSERDVPQAILALGDFNRLPGMMDKLVMGVNAFIALEQVARTTMAADPAFQTTAGPSEPLLDPTRVYYYGNSQGGIFGGSFMAYDPFVTRGVLGVGGANYSIYLERSTDWPLYQRVMAGNYSSPLDRAILLHILQWAWDLSAEPASGLPLLAAGGKQILMQAGVDDGQVNNLGTEWEARTLGLPVLAPAVREPYGLEVMDGPLASALNYFQGEVSPGPLTNTPPPEDTGMHGLVRTTTAANDQMKIFFETGEIVQTCSWGDAVAECRCFAAEDHCGGLL